MSDNNEAVRLPLCAAQLGVWTAQQLDPSSPRYNCGAYLEFHGSIDDDLMRRAVHRAVSEAEALRARFDERGQTVQPVPAEALEVLDLVAEDDPRAAAERWMHADLARCVDLRAQAPVRHVLILLSERGRLLYLRHHHIALDGFGQALHLARIAELYTALGASGDPPGPRSVPLGDLVAEDAGYRGSAAHERDRDYWRAQLGGRPSATGLSGRPPRSARNVLRRSSSLGAGAAGRLHATAERLGTTPSAVLVAAVAAYVVRVTGRPEALLSLPLSARRSRAARGTPAMLSNQLPLLVEASRDSTFSHLVAVTTARLAEMLRHQRYRGEDLHRDLGLAGGQEQPGSPTVNVITFERELTFAGVRVTSHFLSAGPVRDLALSFFVEPDRADVRLVVDADAEAYTPAAAAAHERRLLALLEAACRQPERRVGALPLMPADERRAVLAAGQGPVREYDLGRCLHELVEAQARRTPDAVAVEVEGDALSYRDLVSRARRLAGHLRELGAGPGRVVGVHDERSLDLVVELLAVQLAGAAYLPLDPELPRQRLLFQVEDARVGVVLTRSDLAERLGPVPAEVVAVDERLPALPEVALPATAAPGDAAYVIYTSGSTGVPKGVAVPHRGVVNRLLWMQEEYGLGPADRVLQKTPFTFDVSVWEFFWPLLTGARLHVAAPGAHRDPRAMADVIRRHRITTLHFVPTMLDLFLAEPSAAGLDSLRRVFASGEALNPETVARFFARYGDGPASPALHNLYGPTEASIDVTYWPCRPAGAGGAVPIGRAVANTAVHVLDPDGEPVPPGVPGELHIGGVQLATGYVNRPGLTAERFVANPFGQGRLYRTGDLAVLREDGVVEYRGRLDHQVKVRGFRVELGEIESALLGHPTVVQAVVTAPAQADGQRRLVAYVVPAGTAVNVEELLGALRERLPEYMVPAHVVVLDALPLLSSGKVDRRALPAPEPADGGAAAGAELPATDTERLLHDVWREVLGRDAADVHSSFFALGGDSILSIRMRSALERRGWTFAVADLFAGPSISELAGRLRRMDADGTDRGTVPFSLLQPADRAALPEGVEDAYPLTSLQSGMVFHAGYEEGTSVYRVVTSVHVGLPFDEGALRQALAAVVRRHPALRTSIHLTGFGEPLQLVHREVDVPLAVHEELVGLGPSAQEDRLREWASAVKHHEFDLTRAPLLAFTAHPRGPESFQLGVVEHHAVLDGWSDMAMLDEIVDRCRAAAAGEELWLPEVASTFHRFVAAERRALASEEHRTFWERELAGVEAAPLPRASSTGRRARASHHRFDVPVEAAVARRLGDAARRAQLPLKSLLGAVHVAVMRTVCPGDEVLTGVVSHARLDEDGGDEVIGLFLNTLPLRISAGGATWLELARAVHDHEARTAPHRRYPYGQMARERDDLVLDSYVNFMDFHGQGERGAAVAGGFGVAETDFPLAVDFLVDPLRGRLELWLDCDVAALSPAFCGRLVGYYGRALAAAAADAESVAEAVDLRGPDEARLLRAWNDTATPYEAATVPELVARQVRATPDATAVRHGAGRLTYAELDARAARLAHHLRDRGTRPGGRVGVHVRRGLDLVVTLVAVLRAGAAYVPLDPDFPIERLRYVAADADLDCLVTDGEPDGLPAAAVVSLGADAGAIARRPATAGDAAAGPDDPVYVMYTSGSTGRPKGTVLRHRNVVNFFAGMDEAIGIGPADTVLALTSISFDISVLELLWPLTRGAAVAVAGERMIDRLVGDEDESFVAACERHRPTLLQSTPSFLAAVAAAPEALRALAPLRALLVGGEAFPSGLARQLLAALPSVRVCNMYGPTETTIWSTVHELDRERDGGADVLPIGRPIANTALRIAAPDGAATPVGVAGELWIGGDGVAAGYRGRPELTAERFVHHEGACWYRTGDRVRWREDGVVEFLGRLDRQVKIAGHRVELDEVESVISRHPAVASVAVVATRRPDGTADLLAYIAPVAGGAGAGGQEAHLDRWRDVWDLAYAGGPDGDGGEFAGWTSSYTGDPIPASEMRAWLRGTVDRCAALGGRRVVDVGIGVGLFLRELAPAADSYLGLDVSEHALRRAAAALPPGAAAGHVAFEVGDALALARQPDASADLVLLNSVVQYFPSADYLRRVLREAVRVAGPLGAVFVGDVRDLGLLDAFHAHVQVHRAQALTPAGDVAAAARRARADERELCLAPGFFAELAAGDPRIGTVHVELKRGSELNELTRFRYDVTLLGASRAGSRPAGSPELGWEAGQRPEAIAELLAVQPPERPVDLRDIPNRRTAQPLAALRLLGGATDAGLTAWDLQRLLWEHDGADAVDPERLVQVGGRLGRSVLLLPSGRGDPGRFDVRFAPVRR